MTQFFEKIYYSKPVIIALTAVYGFFTGLVIYAFLTNVLSLGLSVILLVVLLSIDIYLFGYFLMPLMSNKPALIIDRNGLYIEYYSQFIDWNEIDSISCWEEGGGRYSYRHLKIGIRLHNLDDFIQGHPDLKYLWAIKLNYRYKKQHHYILSATPLKIKEQDLYEKLTRYHKEFSQTNNNSDSTGSSL